MSTALITGANRGLGQQLARMLATDGWDVLVGARDKQKADATAARLRKDTGGRLKGVVIDVLSDESVTMAAQKLRDGAIKIDALVNNAGVMKGDILETNFFGPLRVTLGLQPLLRGTVVNVTSSLAEDIRIDDLEALIAHVRAYRGRNEYGFSKGALNALTKIFARELAPIRFTAVDPGWCRTDMGGRGAPRSIEQGASAIQAALR